MSKMTKSSGAPAASSRSASLWLGVLIAAFLIRLLYVLQISRNPDLLIPLFDAQGFVARADQWIRGKGLSSEVFDVSLLQHLFLSACFFVTDASLSFARGAQALLGAITCALIAHIADRRYGRRAGIMAGVMAVLYGPAIILNAKLIPATLETLWLVALFATTSPTPKQRWPHWALGGLGVLLGPRFALIWLALTAFRRKQHRESPAGGSARGWLVASAAFFAPLLVGFVLLNGQLVTGGTLDRWAANVYLGNSGDLCRTLSLRPGPERVTLLERAQREADQLGISTARFFIRETTSAFRENPVRVFGGLGAKALHLLSSRELPSALDIREGHEAAPIIRPLMWQVGRLGFPFALLLALAAAGIAFKRRELDREYLILLMVPAFLLIATRVTAPDRLPWAFLLFPLAGAGLASLTTAKRERPTAMPAAVTVASLGAFLLSVVPGPFCVEAASGRAERARSIGTYFLQRYEMERAAAYFQEALARDPTDAAAWNGKGICEQMRGALGEARRSFARAIELQPDYTLALFNLASVESTRGHPEQAATLLQRGLALQPRNGQAHNDLGRALLQLGDAAQAVTHFKTARRLNPMVLEPRLNLALAFEAQGKLDEARDELNDALTRAPTDAALHTALGFVKLRLGETDAEGHFLAARDLAPRTADAYYGLAVLSFNANRRAEARQLYAKAFALDHGRGLARLTPEEQAWFSTSP